jgi:catechol 2,3-dioxygenase-like lactoylglutathione lyase family enzyme
MTQTSITGEQSPGTTRLRRIATTLLLIACAFVFSATPTPVLAEDLQLSPVRRTTIASVDPEASLRFYRDLLGFTVEYDVVATEPGQLAAFAPGATKGRAIALRSGEKMGGSIGLVHTPGMKRGGQCKATAASVAVAILLLTNDLDTLYRHLKTAGVPFVNEPHTYDAGRGHGPTGTFTVFDPDCVRVAFAQVQRETLEQSERR